MAVWGAPARACRSRRERGERDASPPTDETRPADDSPSPPDGDRSPTPATEVSVRRTGGFAGRTVERTVTLAELPRPDARAWQSLLADDSLPTLAQEAAAVQPVPDSFCYAVTCNRPPIDVELPETTLSADVRSLLERTLAPGTAGPAG